MIKKSGPPNCWQYFLYIHLKFSNTSCVLLSYIFINNIMANYKTATRKPLEFNL